MSKEKPAGKAKKAWKPDEGFTLSPLQKVILVAVISFIPFFLFIILPLLSREHFIKNLKIPEEIFLSTPEAINLVSTADAGPTYKVNINSFEFKIPIRFTPTRINATNAEFRADPRSESRYIYILGEPNSRTMDFSAGGIATWFMPAKLQNFLPLILNADWHPIRLMFKAQFYSSEGITSKIFEAKWDLHHRGYVFQTPDQKGYLGRVFRTNRPGYFEFLMVDIVNPVSLREWVNVAMKIKPPEEDEKPIDPLATPSMSLQALTELAAIPERQSDALSGALSEFFKTKSPEWLIPVASIMQAREFYPELINLHKQYLNRFPVDSPYKKAWNDILDNAVGKILKIEIDPQMGMRELKIFCHNLTKLEIGQVWLKIIIKEVGEEKSFMAPLLPQGRILPDEEKELVVKSPADISLTNNIGIEYRIVQIDFIR